MSKNKNISTPQVADPRDVKVGLISALFSILVLMILLFFITYEIANPLPKDEVVNAETIVGEILLEDLKIESGSIGGGSESNDPVDADLKRLLSAPIEDEVTVQQVLSALRTHKALDESREQLHQVAKQARGALGPLPINDATGALMSLCDAVIDRSA